MAENHATVRYFTFHTSPHHGRLLQFCGGPYRVKNVLMNLTKCQHGRKPSPRGPILWRF